MRLNIGSWLSPAELDAADFSDAKHNDTFDPQKHINSQSKPIYEPIKEQAFKHQSNTVESNNMHSNDTFKTMQSNGNFDISGLLGNFGGLSGVIESFGGIGNVMNMLGIFGGKDSTTTKKQSSKTTDINPCNIIDLDDYSRVN